MAEEKYMEGADFDNTHSVINAYLARLTLPIDVYSTLLLYLIIFQLLFII